MRERWAAGLAWKVESQHPIGWLATENIRIGATTSLETLSMDMSSVLLSMSDVVYSQAGL